MSLAENDDVIQALAADRPDQPFGNAVVKSSQLHSYRLIRRKPSWLRMSFIHSTGASSGSQTSTSLGEKTASVSAMTRVS